MDLAMLKEPHLPYTLTWTAKELYLTRSSSELKVYRVNLFRPHPSETDNAALRPREPIVLPASAKRRAVHYFPPMNGCRTSKIIIGCEKEESQTLRPHENPIECEGATSEVSRSNERRLLPPVGCFLDVDKDLGGWEKAKGYLDICGSLKIGDLDRRMEKFNPEEDCEDCK